MKTNPRTRRLESLIYVGIWTVGMALFILENIRIRSYGRALV